MVKAYKCFATTYMDGKEIHDMKLGMALKETEPVGKTLNLDWSNIDHSICGLEVPFSIWHRKKGRVISFWETNLTKKHLRDIKEWKSPINFTVEIKYVEYEPSINEILKYSNGELAIKYLVERGLSVVGK